IGGDGKLGLSALEQLDQLRRRPAQQLDVQLAEQPVELAEMPRQQLQIDRARQGELERSDLAALDRRRQRPRSEPALVALLEQRIDALAELGQLRLRPLAAEQVAAELLLELLDRAGERGLRDVTFLRSLGEIQLADRRQEISDLVHFHA